MKTVLFLLFFAAMHSGCASNPKVPDGPRRVIDAHIHTRFTGEKEAVSGIPQTGEQLLMEMRDSNVVAAVAHTDGVSASKEEGYVGSVGDRKIVHCAGIRGKKVDVRKLERSLKSGRFNCLKIYLGYVHQYAFDPNYRPAYRLAEKYDVPVVFHTGDTYSTRGKLKYADPLTIDEVAVDHPKVDFVIAHVGNPWIRSAAEVAYKNPNVYVDGSALLIGDLNELPRGQVDRYVVEPLSWAFGYMENPKKLMFGSDWPLTDISSYIDAFKRAIPREHWDAVFHDNAARVFRIERDQAR